MNLQIPVGAWMCLEAYRAIVQDSTKKQEAPVFTDVSSSAATPKTAVDSSVSEMNSVDDKSESSSDEATTSLLLLQRTTRRTTHEPAAPSSASSKPTGEEPVTGSQAMTVSISDVDVEDDFQSFLSSDDSVQFQSCSSVLEQTRRRKRPRERRTPVPRAKVPRTTAPEPAEMKRVPSEISSLSLDEIYKLVKNENSSSKDGNPNASTVTNLETAVLVKFIEMQITPRLDVLTSAYSKLEVMYRTLTSCLSQVTEDQKAAQRKITELNNRLTPRVERVRKPLTMSAMSNSNTPLDFSVQEKLICKVDALLSSLQNGKCKSGELEQELRSILDILSVSKT